MAVPTVPSSAHALAYAPFFLGSMDRDDLADDFVAGDTREQFFG